MKITKGLIFKILFIILLILTVVFFFRSQQNIKTIPVRKVEVENRVVEKTISASGEVKSRTEADLAFGTLGTLAQINVSEGDEVEKGELLASLNAYTLSQTAQAARDARDIAIRDLELYIENYSTKQDAVGGKDEYALNVRKLEEAVSQAEATYQARIGSLSDAYIYAPFSGTIVSVNKVEGEEAAATEAVIKLADLSQLYFEIELDQEDYGTVATGQSAEITLDSYDNIEFSGTVEKLPLFVNGSGNTTFKVELSINAVESTVPLMGMTGDAKIVTAQTSSEVPSIFYDELFFDEEDNPYVWVVDNNLLNRYYLETGLEGDVYTEVLNAPETQIVRGLNDDIEVKEGYKASIQQ